MSETPSDSAFSSSVGAGPPEEGVGLSNPELSKGRRRLLDLANRLHSTGVQKDIDLPMIAVIGSQSAGKSSLIESISGITLPRAAGTCTRCPTECRLSYSHDPWKCVVQLRFGTDEKGQPLGQALNITFGDTITDKSMVEERIRRAQRAILNPSTSHRTFLEGDDEDPADKPQLTFSTNCVSLAISGKDVADLSFVDLPGLIASVGTGGNAGDIDLVKNLVGSYISKPSCLILLTVTCETDFENQGAYKLAKDNDRDGKRTIGVLTKPDRAPAGEEDRWLRFIRNEVEPLENNWYAVKQPDSKALKQGLTWKEARTQEDLFFSMTEPWSSLDHMYQKYLRTSNLTERLSVILSDLISKRLPEIQEELQSLLRRTEESIQRLPKPPSQDAFGEIMHRVGQFVRDLERHLEGTPDKDDLLQSIRPAQERFKKAIRATAPNFKPFEKRFSATRSIPKAAFLSHEEEAEEESDEESDEEIEESLEETTRRRFRPWVPAAFARVVDDADGDLREPNAIYIDQVLERANQARTRELPDIYPFVVHEAFISQVKKQWPNFARDLFEDVQNILAGYVKKLVKKHFAAFGRGDLNQRVLLVLADHIKKCSEKTMEQIEWLTRLEERPFTLNEHYYIDYREKFLSHYRGWRQNDNNSLLMKSIHNYKPSPPEYRNGQIIYPAGIPKIISGFLDIGVTTVKPTDIPKILPSDPMEPALTIMADARAYFQVAYKRFTDNVPLAIDLELIRGLKAGMERALYSGLGVSGPEGHRICKELVQEHPNVTARRAELQKKWERLNTASQELVHIGI